MKKIEYHKLIIDLLIRMSDESKIKAIDFLKEENFKFNNHDKKKLGVMPKRKTGDK